jgi:predicted ATPase
MWKDSALALKPAADRAAKPAHTSPNLELIVQTNWVVLTGCPSAGKTTVIEGLAELGYKTCPEFAREYFQRELEAGRTIQEIRQDKLALRRTLIEETKAVERRLDPRELVILDRAVPDNIAFAELEGLNVAELLGTWPFRYRQVFNLESLPLENDGVRDMNSELNDRLEAQNIAAYRRLGYDVISVPRYSSDRTESIRNRISLITDVISRQALLDAQTANL